MPFSLRFVAALMAMAAGSAPISLYVQHLHSVHAARADATALTGGDPDAGRAATLRYNCGACHGIGGVPGADGQVGPALKDLTKRTELANRLPNDPQSLILWIQHPQQIEPGSGMPELGVSEREARDIAAYLYSRR